MEIYWDAETAAGWVVKPADYSSYVYEPCTVTFLLPGQPFVWSGQEVRVATAEQATLRSGALVVDATPEGVAVLTVLPDGRIHRLVFTSPAAQVLARPYSTPRPNGAETPTDDEF